MRFAGDYLSNSLEATPVKDKPLVQGFNAEDFQQQPQEVALAPAAMAGIGLLGKGLKAYTALRVGQAALDGGRVNPGTRADYAGQDPTAGPNTTSGSQKRAGGGIGRVIADMSDGKKESLRGPTLRSPYHQ